MCCSFPNRDRVAETPAFHTSRSNSDLAKEGDSSGWMKPQVNDGASGGERDLVRLPVFRGGDGKADAVCGQEVLLTVRAPGETGLAGGGGFQRHLHGHGCVQFEPCANEERGFAFWALLGRELKDAVLRGQRPVAGFPALSVGRYFDFGWRFSFVLGLLAFAARCAGTVFPSR